MFNRIGKKIKTLAMVIAIAGIVMSVLSGIWAGNYLDFVIIVLLGVFVSWVSVFLLYGFGELVDQAVETNQRLAENHAALEEILALMKGQHQIPSHSPSYTEMASPSAEPQRRKHEREQKPERDFVEIDSVKLPLRNDQDNDPLKRG